MRVRCSQIERQLAEYVDGALPPAREAAVAGHLADCARCRAELELLRQSLRVLERLPAAEPAGDLWAGLQARLAASAAGSLSCPRAQELLPGYVDDALDLAGRAAVARHLSTCVACAAEEELYRRSLALIDGLPAAAPPADLWARVAARLDAPRPRPGWLPVPRRAWGFAGAAAGLVAATIAVLLLGPGRSQAPGGQGLVAGATPPVRIA